jgi:hypothetical protein
MQAHGIKIVAAVEEERSHSGDEVAAARHGCFRGVHGTDIVRPTVTLIRPPAFSAGQRAAEYRLSDRHQVFRLARSLGDGLPLDGLRSQLASPIVALDLGGAWTPRPAAQADGKLRTSSGYLAWRTSVVPMASRWRQRWTRGARRHPAVAAIVRSVETERHDCHAKIDHAANSALTKIDKPLGQDHGGVVASDNNNRRYLAGLLIARASRRSCLRSGPRMAKTDPQHAVNYRAWRKVEDQYQGIVAAQRHLVCEGLLREQDADGSMTWRTGVALEMFQRRNFLMPNNRLDDETRAALRTESRELDFRSTACARARVDAAAIEDGTAVPGP